MLTYAINKHYNSRIQLKIRRNLAKHKHRLTNFDFKNFTFSNSEELVSPNDILIEHRGSTINFACRDDIFSSKYPDAYGCLKNRSATFLFYVALAGDVAKHLVCDTSDGNNLSMADFRFSSPLAKDGLLPDAFFFESEGYKHQRDLYANKAVPWAKRSDKIVWRGGLNGEGLRLCDEQLISNGAVHQRARMAFACKGTDIDFKFANAGHESRVLSAQGLMGERIDTTSWLQRKFAIDVDGYSNAWDNLFHRLLFGCCVLKVESQAGFRQWYYDKLVPFEHYVPIKADLSDLHEKTDWVQSNPQDAERIAAAGCELAHSMTFESEAEYAVREIQRICEAKNAASL